MTLSREGGSREVECSRCGRTVDVHGEPVNHDRHGRPFCLTCERDGVPAPPFASFLRDRGLRAEDHYTNTVDDAAAFEREHGL